MKTVKCPICGKDVEFYEKRKLPPNFPFCSQRCKLIDLGKWLDEDYRISEPIPEGFDTETQPKGYVPADDENRNHNAD